MSLLADIQADAINTATPLSALLRKCLVLASRLNNADLKAWAQQELEGYDSETELPTYRRKRTTTAQGDFSGPMNSWWRGAEIPSHVVAPEHREALFSVEFRQSVAEFESLLGADGQMFQVPWDTNAVALYAERIYENLACVRAWRVVPRGAVEGVLDQIRTKILAFALEIESLNPDAGERDRNQGPGLPAEKVTQVFHSVFYGPVAAVGLGHTTQQFVTNVVPGDRASLVQALHEAGIPDTDLESLEAALKGDASTLPERLRSWQETVTAKIKTGTISLVEGVSTTVIAEAIMKFLGLI